ncbi:MAG: divalent-cation tolerance protein CutA [Gemmatimonadota bacterium]
MDPQVRTVLVTVPDPAAGEALGRTLVEERLAACANVVPGIVSVYRWEGTVQRDSEALVILKTTAAGVEALRDRIVRLHPYDVPEVLALPVVGGHGPYLRWVEDAVEAGDGSI